jgi:hypothetical protein
LRSFIFYGKDERHKNIFLFCKNTKGTVPFIVLRQILALPDRVDWKNKNDYLLILRNQKLWRKKVLKISTM